MPKESMATTAVSAEAPPEDAQPAGRSKKRLILIVAGVALVLLLGGGGGAAWWMLKKSPKAVRGYQAFAQLLAIDEGINFPRGGTYFRIYGEGFSKGQGMHVHEAPPPRQTPRPRGR